MIHAYTHIFVLHEHINAQNVTNKKVESTKYDSTTWKITLLMNVLSYTHSYMIILGQIEAK